ncbi:hypothetical protein [Flavobacterium sp. 245]|uniref:5'-methylthioadenosine/S-adenosylhomocysteine nucleosidase family protein n=1 Tax=Flavobacterium sp. 245 TaxID=2512115 RepID=UPI00105EE9E2|nr:hypothetical protein [Flavobacterium sp. 245]TDP00332.1 nucleoside phosphorylase [Flavobacterium sp. 245]
MNSLDVILFVFDEEEHYQKNLNNLGKDSFKKPIRIDSLASFERELNLLDKDTLVHLVVHIFYSDNIVGIQQFISSGIREKYPLLDTRFISDGTTSIINEKISGKEFSSNDKEYIEKRIQKYYSVRPSIESEEVKISKVKDHLKIKNTQSDQDFHDVDYVIITALEQDEMTKVLPLIQTLQTIENSKHLIELGYFKSKPDKKVIYASQINSGMVDAAILATELICLYKPKFLIMTGVMGGKPDDTRIGDVIISKKVFTIDKGKLTEDEFKREIESVSTESSYTVKIDRIKSKIIDFIKEKDEIYNTQVNIHCEPVACVRSVIDREGFFESDVLTVDRKTIGLEMEGYGIARACEIVNDGKTIPLIIKSVMDNTQKKTDGAKKLAAWTSAKVLEYIIMHDVI